jgi:cell fate (sporulation/competence/biofilm development) regulator YmcA (YheA/YmcA/DUF963 family)
MFISPHQNAVQNHNLMAAIKYFENVTRFKYLETKVTNKTCIHKEIKSILNSENAY